MNSVEIDITEEMTQRAFRKAIAVGEIKNSLLKGKGNFHGFLGEEMVLSLFPTLKRKDNKDFDLILDTEDPPLKIEVKTKRRNVPPKDEYTCHIPATSTHQDPDVYVFCQVTTEEPYKGYVLGWLPKEVFYKVSDHRKKGQVDKYGFTEKADGFVCKISDLMHPIDFL